ncbi:phospholipid scramblase family member 5 [Nycticebus coucang]|uniref:phospholipid scramblase family member 5 n=1 Tax=Nycticebus coucang TaxID=9470 RepID=UPI00234CF02B|nr:phospholipid scramblase family member 5 [Nycticebus coucang]
MAKWKLLEKSEHGAERMDGVTILGDNSGPGSSLKEAGVQSTVMAKLNGSTFASRKKMRPVCGEVSPEVMILGHLKHVTDALRRIVLSAMKVTRRLLSISVYLCDVALPSVVQTDKIQHSRNSQNSLPLLFVSLHEVDRHLLKFNACSVFSPDCNRKALFVFYLAALEEVPPTSSWPLKLMTKVFETSAEKNLQSQKSRILPGFLPGVPDSDQSFRASPSNAENQVWQPGLSPPSSLPTVSLPPGLEYLSQLDLIIIHQQVELLGMILGTETSNKYEIKNSLGQRIYFAVEESICFNRTFCSTLRSCTLRITDNSGREVITVNRPLRCNSCWFPCYLQELEIQAPPGTIVGYVTQKWDPFLPKFTIQNANKEDILKIVGPCATCGCFGDVDFEIKTINEKLTIGKISKYWSGFVNDVFTNADNFGIHVPADLDVSVKAAMIGACFLLDFMFFEHSLAGL